MESAARLVDPSDLLDAAQAADLLGVTRARVNQLHRSGKLRAVLRRDRWTLFHREDVHELLEQREQVAAA